MAMDVGLAVHIVLQRIRRLGYIVNQRLFELSHQIYTSERTVSVSTVHIVHTQI